MVLNNLWVIGGLFPCGEGSIWGECAPRPSRIPMTDSELTTKTISHKYYEAMSGVYVSRIRMAHGEVF